MFIEPPIDYIQPVFRPPSEGRSLILQVTNGCSYNACTFCEMYQESQKKFRPKPQAEIENEVFSAKEALRQNVAQLAVAGASKILRREVENRP